MDSSPPLRVTLTGDVSGAYRVVEQRSDGSLVVVPDVSKRTRSAPARSASPIATLLSGLVSSAETSMTGVEVLEDWGVELNQHERVEEFFIADVDDEAGFVAITSERFIFVASSGNGAKVRHQHLLSAASKVELIRRGLRHRLRVSWHGAESLIAAPDRKAIARLRRHLEGRGSS